MTSAALIRRRRSSASLLSLYSALGIRPELAFDFANERYFTSRVPTTFSGAITHTRASTATYVDSSGVLQTAASGVPRVGHHVWNGSAWVNEGLLHESEARTNSRQQSADLSVDGFTANTGGSVVLTGSQPDPNGGTTGFVLSGMTVNGDYRALNASTAVTAGQTWTGSLWLKGAAGTFVEIGVSRTGATTYEETRRLIALTGEWQRESVSHTYANNHTAARLDVGRIGNASVGSSVSMAWCQIELGPTPSSYIPTAGSTVTRAADVLTIPAANLPWPEPVVIGPELVTNGTFDTDISGWTDASSAGGSIAWNAAGYADVTNTTGTARIQQAMTVIQGRIYKIAFDAINAGTTLAYIGSNAGNNDYLSAVPITTGANEIFVVAVSSTTLSLRVSHFSTGTLGIDNISVREINPLAVSIQMDGAINYSDEGVAAQQTFLRWQLDANNYISVDLDTDSTATGEVNFNQAASGTVDTVATAGNALSPSIATAFNIASRNGSTFINGALGGTALTADTTPVALPDLSATDLNLGFDYNGTIKTVRIWANDVTDPGLEAATT